MAFPLAHPAAVLPLRRFCPRWLSFPALVIGSLAPDAGYLFSAKEMDGFSHTFWGSGLFSLPVGILAMLVFCALRSSAVRMLPEPYRRALLPMCQKPCGPIFAVLISLLIGAWTHFFWDACTHKDGWIVEHVPVLHAALFTTGYRTARVCVLVWYATSFAGLIWLVLAFEKWKQTHVMGSAHVSVKVVLRDAVVVALLLVPIQLAHHFLRGWEPVLFVAAVLCALLAIVIPLRLRNAREAGITTPPAAEGQDSA